MKKPKGITMISLVITVLLMLLLSSVTIKIITQNEIVEKAEESKLRVDYKLVENDLLMHKMKVGGVGLSYNEVSDESLIGTLYKKILIKDTSRELAVIVDFEEMNSEPMYGAGGNKILKEDNNNKDSVKEVNTIYDLKDIYAVDLEDKSLYYINGEQIYTLYGETVELEEEGTIVKKYAVETISQSYFKRKKFITKWNVTLGETEGSETYSTVVLPVNSSSTYDATIYWGDGTSTILQNNVNGVTLTSAKIIDKVTHNYTLAEDDNSIKTIEIDGIYTNFNVGNKCTKLKLIGIEQWGNTGLTNISFQNCSNLSGIIPKNDLTELNCTSYCFSQTSITGLEEGFYFSGGSFNHAFRDCKNLKTIPNSFKIPEGTTSLAYIFKECSSLEKLPDNFEIPDSVTSLYETFYQCSSLKEIPESFKIPEKVTSVYSLFAGCSSLEKIPSDFSLPKGITGIGVANLFNGCGKLTQISENFALPDEVTNIAGLFGSSGITKLPKDFKIPYGVTSLSNAFMGCVFESFPDNFEIPETVTNLNNAFRGCKYLKGTIIMKANPTDYTACFGYGTSVSSGSTLTVNYSKNCTNIDDILATGNASYVVKGEQID